MKSLYFQLIRNKTTAETELPVTCCRNSSRSRMSLPDWSRELEDGSTSHHQGSCSGYQFDSALTSSYFSCAQGVTRPAYLAEDCQLLTDIGSRSLRSAYVLTCATKRTRTHIGDRSFSVVGPCLWNSHYVTETSHLHSLRDFWRHFGLCRAAAHI